MGGGAKRAEEGLVRPAVDRDMQTCQLADLSRIGEGALHLHVACHGGNAADIQLLQPRSGQQRCGVVHTGIHIEPNGVLLFDHACGTSHPS